jgi:hypothetical protein
VIGLLCLKRAALSGLGGCFGTGSSGPLGGEAEPPTHEWPAYASFAQLCGKKRPEMTQKLYAAVQRPVLCDPVPLRLQAAAHRENMTGRRVAHLQSIGHASRRWLPCSVVSARRQWSCARAAGILHVSSVSTPAPHHSASPDACRKEQRCHCDGRDSCLAYRESKSRCDHTPKVSLGLAKQDNLAWK